MADGIIVQITASLPPGLLQDRARALAGELTAAGVPAAPAQAPAGPGTKGGELLLGALLLEPVGKWAVETLLDRLRAFLVRDQTMKVTLKRPDGAEIAIEATNMDRAEVARWIETARDGLR